MGRGETVSSGVVNILSLVKTDRIKSRIILGVIYTDADGCAIHLSSGYFIIIIDKRFLQILVAKTFF